MVIKNTRNSPIWICFVFSTNKASVVVEGSNDVTVVLAIVVVVVGFNCSVVDVIVDFLGMCTVSDDVGFLYVEVWKTTWLFLELSISDLDLVELTLGVCLLFACLWQSIRRSIK